MLTFTLEFNMQQLNSMLDDLVAIGERRANLMVELSKSIDLNDLPYDVFKHGSCKMAWQVKCDGAWTGEATYDEWSSNRPKRAWVKRGDVDVIYIPAKEVPSSVKRPWK